MPAFVTRMERLMRLKPWMIAIALAVFIGLLFYILTP